MRSVSLFLTFSLTAFLAAPAAAQTTDPSCLPATAMVLFDRSTSMIRGTIDGKTRWSVATSALKDVVSAYQDKVQFGLTVFPKDAGTCKTGGNSVVDPKLDALASINTALGAALPGTNDWTPIGQTLQKLAALPSMTDPRTRRFVILVTDGAQSCPEGLNGNPDEGDEIWPVMTQVLQVKNLKAQGVTTYVIGFGKTSMTSSGDDGVDALALNQLALAGGTAPNGCDPDGTDPTSDKNCYYQADNAAALVAALDEIAILIQHRECGSDEGECTKGMQTCVDGTWGACMGGTAPSTETCDGKDNDCNGVADPGCQCVAGDTRACGGPAAGTCKTGTQVCLPGGTWSTECTGAVAPINEICDGKDNDCNGVIDNPSNSSIPLCGSGQVCTQGSCQRATPPGALAGGEPAGCAVGGTAPLPLGAGLLFLLGLAFVARRRRS